MAFMALHVRMVIPLPFICFWHNIYDEMIDDLSLIAKLIALESSTGFLESTAAVYVWSSFGAFCLGLILTVAWRIRMRHDARTLKEIHLQAAQNDAKERERLNALARNRQKDLEEGRDSDAEGNMSTVTLIVIRVAHELYDGNNR
jgi:heme exporter protein D